MENKNLKKLVVSALFAALTCVATISIPIPTPTGGYVHPGDALVFLSGLLLGPLYGAAAAGIGSMFADIILGYFTFALATLMIKALAAFIVGYIFNKFNIKFSTIFAGIGGSIIIVLGYFIFESFIVENSFIAALASVPPNIIQTTVGIIISTILFPAIKRFKQ